MVYSNSRNRKRRSYVDIFNNLSILLLIIYFCFPIMNSFSNIFRVGYTSICISVFYLTVLMKNTKLFMKILNTTILIFVFITLSYFAQWAEKTTFFQQIYFLFLFWVPFIMMLYIVETNDRKLYKAIIITTIVSLALTSITTIRGITLYPFASRYLATGQSELYNLDMYRRINIGGYDFIYGLVLMIPVLIYLIHWDKRHRIIYFSIIALYTVCIIKSQYTIAVLMVIISLALLFIKRINFKTVSVILLALITIFLIFQMDIAAIFFNMARMIGKNGYIMLSKRLTEIADSISQSGAIGGLSRYNLYGKSIQAFIYNPILGTLINPISNYTPGGHSSLLDTLGFLGLLGMGFIIYFCSLFYKKVKENFSKHNVYSYVKYLMLATVILATLNTIFSSVLISIVLFVVSYSASSLEDSQFEYLKKD